MNRNSYGYVFKECFLQYPQIQRVLQRGGFKAYGLLYIVCAYLKHCKCSVGLTDDLCLLARKAKMRVGSLKEWMSQSGLFVIDDEKGLFCFPCFRHYLGLADTPSDEEIKDIVNNGNIYKAEPKKSTDDTDDKACTDDNDTVTDEQETDTNATINQLQNSQDVDSEEVKASAYRVHDTSSNSRISLQSSESTENNTITTSTADSEKVEVEGGVSFDFFRKNLLSNQDWLDKISKIRCVNVWDKDEAEVFARWMYDYSTCYGIVYKDADAMRHHAFCLLAQGRNTRKMFDAYVKIELKRLRDKEYEEEQRRYNKPVYEYRMDGHRYAYHGEILPRDAPEQPSRDVRWSYIQKKWVSGTGYDAEKEWAYEEEEIKKIIARRKNKKSGKPA